MTFLGGRVLDVMLRAYAFARHVAVRVRDERLAEAAGSLTFTTVLALVPLGVIVFAALTPFPLFERMRSGLRRILVDQFVPPALAETILSHLNVFASKAAGLTFFGLGVLAVSALLMMLTVDRVVNRVWHVRYDRPVHQRVMVYSAVLALGPILLASSLMLTSYALTLAGLGRRPPVYVALVLDFMPVLGMMLGFAALYRYVPHRRVPWRDVWVAAACAAVAFEVAKYGFALYIAHFATVSRVYGSLAVLPLFLLWIYVSWLIALTGAVIAAGWSDWRRGAGPSEEAVGRRFALALTLLRDLSAPKDGAPDLDELTYRSDGYVEEVEQVLAGLQARGLVRPALRSGSRWRPRLGPLRWELSPGRESTTVGELYRALVYDGSSVATAVPATWVLDAPGRVPGVIDMEALLRAPLDHAGVRIADLAVSRMDGAQAAR